MARNPVYPRPKFQLERLFDVFRLMLELPKPDAADNTVHLSEDATTLRALLSLTASGVGHARRINSLSLVQLEGHMTAADKYDIPSAPPIVASCLQQRADDLDPWRPDDQDPWHLFGIVKRFGFTDLEASVRLKPLQTRLDSTPYPSYLSGADVYNVMLERKQRVDEFCYALTLESWDAPFAVYNRRTRSPITQLGNCYCTRQDTVPNYPIRQLLLHPARKHYFRQEASPCTACDSPNGLATRATGLCAGTSPQPSRNRRHGFVHGDEAAAGSHHGLSPCRKLRPRGASHLRPRPCAQTRGACCETVAGWSPRTNLWHGLRGGRSLVPVHRAHSCVVRDGCCLVPVPNAHSR
ncbi:hypothetical protein EXIGLDRAFT_807761 [Exidia glandulosa HHB12029]|uniref:Uncharacterized protein n=1 Tax=Exidia glandulosa HHB12029 TaxID=1314781 RepID=A0A165LWY9_EXIGL|nr:hypothetical protein EXIGLDRAFT_807761 [Exidia glandulosa HHB12029]